MSDSDHLKANKEASPLTLSSADPPSMKLFFLEARAVVELWSLIPALPILKKAPMGDGHPVLVFPGFATGDWSTLSLRWFLNDRGYSVHGWRLGHNTGYSEQLDALMFRRLKEIYDRYGRKVSLVGWSLGGVYARELARWRPNMVRNVVTMGSPFCNLKGTNLWRLYEFISGNKLADVDPALLQRMKMNPPVPTTSIYSRSDGIVSYRSSKIEEKTAHTENIEVPTSHCGLVLSPFVFWAIADRLAQPEGKWAPFDLSGNIKKIFYGSPDI